MKETDDEVTFVERNIRTAIIEEEEEEEENRPKQSRCERFFTSRRNRFLALVVIVAIVVPTLMFYFLIERPLATETVYHTCAILKDFRIPCGDGNFTQQRCTEINCCFDYTDEYCYHYAQSKYAYVGGSVTFWKPNITTDVFGNNATERLKVTVQHVTENKLKVILHNAVYDSITLENTLYTVRAYEEMLGFDIYRNDGPLLLTTGLGPLMVSENYLEWSFYMGETLFGLDELLFSSNETYRKVIYKNRNDHTTIPGFMAYVNGSYHGLVFQIAGPVEFSVLPSRLVSVRVLSSEEISFTLVMGPTPKDVQQQLYEFDLPPRWLLEPHICRNGSTDLDSLIDEYMTFNETNQIHYATDCLHESLYYMLHSLNETEVEPLSSIVGLINANSRFVMTVYPHVLIENETSIYDSAESLHLLYTYVNDSVYTGVHLDQQVAYLDYDAEKEYVDYWFEEVLQLFESLDIFGFSLKDNWPDDEDFQMKWLEGIPYLNGVFVEPMSHTIAWNASTYLLEPHFRVHNDYARGQIEMFRRKFGQDHLITTSSYQVGMDNVIAQVQNMNTSWVNLKRSIKSTLLHGLFSSPFISIPICGSTSEYEPIIQTILCSRWYITAATFPIFSVSSDFPRRDHMALPSGHSRNIAEDAIKKREMFLPYLYTVLARKEVITRPMFYDFYEDEYTHVLDEQYMFGDALLVAQPLLRDTYVMVVYLPEEAGGFYEFFGGEYYGESLGNVSLSVVVESDWIVFMREGKIVPLQNINGTYTLAVGLTLSTDERTASGTLFFNAAALEMTADNSTLYLSNLDRVREDLNCTGTMETELPTIISDAIIYGLDKTVSTVATLDEVDLCETNTNELEIDYFV